MAGFLPKGDYIRFGTLELGVYLPDISGATISTPTINSVTSYTYTLNEVLVSNRKRFNVGYTSPGSQRTIKAVYASLDKNGILTFTNASAGTTHTPAAADNIALVHLTVPAKCLYILLFVDDQLARIVQSDPRCRRSGLATVQVVKIYYEPAGQSLAVGDLSSLQTGYSPLEVRRFALPNTTGELNHEIQLTKIEVPINDLPTEYITTRSSQRITGTLVGPQSYVQALFTQGTASFICGCGTNETQLGYRGGTCSENRIYELTFPGDECGKQFDALIYGKAVHGEDAQSVAYSSEAVSNLPFTIVEASSSMFKGEHSLTLLPV